MESTFIVILQTSPIQKKRYVKKSEKLLTSSFLKIRKTAHKKFFENPKNCLQAVFEKYLTVLTFSFLKASIKLLCKF